SHQFRVVGAGEGLREAGSAAEPLNDLAERPESDALPVRKAAACHDRGAGPRRELGDEPRLADSGRTEQRELAAALLALDAPEGDLEPSELFQAADEALLEPARNPRGMRVDSVDA